MPSTDDKLFAQGAPKTYTGRQLDNIAFPLGGIGTGAISLGGWGDLRDFEIFNRPGKGNEFRQTFFTLALREGDRAPVARVLQGPVGTSDFARGGFGIGSGIGAGLPHFRYNEFIGGYPFARLRFLDEAIPLDVELEAFNPFIPLNADDSGLPAALFNVSISNHTDTAFAVTLYANCENRIGHPDVGGGVIESYQSTGVRGVSMGTSKHAPDSPRYGTMALVTPHADVSVQTHWYRGRWFDELQRFWDQVSTDTFEECTEKAEREEGTDVATIALRASVRPGDTVRLPVWLTWHMPNFEKYWDKEQPRPQWKNYYATRHADANAVAEYIAAHYNRLDAQTRTFAGALCASTVPACVMDAVSSQISILKSNTCIRVEDGTFYAWEGCSNSGGCCFGSCTHVWNYAQALPYLFPSLERSMRTAHFKNNLHESGHLTFRIPLPMGSTVPVNFHAAADGQMGDIMKTYRDWLICGDDDWLRELWPSVKRALEYAWKYWDRDKDGVMENTQHNTYDVEFFGPNTMMGSFYLGALRAGEEMARRLGDAAAADEYHAVYEKGRWLMDEQLFNGEYFIQDVRPEATASEWPVHDYVKGTSREPMRADFPKYQCGQGCLADQLIGQWFARMLGLGELFHVDHVRAALKAVFTYNWRESMATHANTQRIYAINGEAGLVTCTWPRGGRPRFPFPYSDEAWSGIEYQVASHLIYEGMLTEGLTIVQGSRSRYDGTQRNPWDEIECGHHYARSMASYALLLALSGFRYCAADAALTFTPRINEDEFACFFSVACGWGLLRRSQREGKTRIAVEVIGGELPVRRLTTGTALRGVSAECERQDVAVDAAVADGCTVLTFEPAVVVPSGGALLIRATTS